MDMCVFNKQYVDKQITVCMHVDDIMITCADGEGINYTIDVLQRVYDKLLVARGHTHSYLGMLMDFSTPKRVKITMPGYIDDLLREYNVTGESTTPAANYLFNVSDSPVLAMSDAQEYHLYNS